MLGVTHLELKVEIIKFIVRSQVPKMLMRFPFYLDVVIYQQAIADTPTIVGLGIGQTPAVEILAIEKAHGRAEPDVARGGCRRHWRRAFACKLGFLLPSQVFSWLDAQAFELVPLNRHADVLGQRPLDH